jgi:hypothetical protein
MSLKNLTAQHTVLQVSYSHRRQALIEMMNMVRSTGCARQWVAAAFLAGMIFIEGVAPSHASDHLDTPTVIADPRTDIGDIYAWTSPNGRQLNLVMTIVGHSFSDKIQYAFHVDSGKQFGKTTATTTIACHLASANDMECRAGYGDYARGDASIPDGLEGRNARFRVFAGMRDDPFFNNVKGTRAAYQTAATALKNGAVADAAGCPGFDQATSQAILDQWRHTDGGPATNFLAGWTPASLVISIDLNVVGKGGRMLAVWGSTSARGKQIDRAGRPLTGNALLGTFASADVSDRLKEQYNAATPASSARFIPEIQKALGLYDGFDGKCGNQLIADREAQPSMRYRALATLLADDRLWVNSASSVCTQFFAVELAHLGGQRALNNDCGGRTPNYDAVDVYRSLLVNGTVAGVDDGVDRDEHEHSASVFPFLAAPDAASTYRQ